MCCDFTKVDLARVDPVAFNERASQILADPSNRVTSRWEDGGMLLGLIYTDFMGWPCQVSIIEFLKP